MEIINNNSNNKNISKCERLFYYMVYAIIPVIILFISIFNIHQISNNRSDNDSIKDTIIVDSTAIYKNHSIMIFNQLATEIENYMYQYTKNPKLPASYVITQCINNDFDITLLLSQAHVESHFGSLCRNNSCFGVISKKYKTINHAVDDYIRIMTTYYIINRDTDDLINDNFRQELNKNAKYASSPTYASHIKEIRDNIIQNTDIDSLYQSLQNTISKYNQLSYHNSSDYDKLSIDKIIQI